MLGAGLRRELPAQNILAGFAAITGVGVLWVSLTGPGWPAGTGGGGLAWTVRLGFWAVAVLASRGVARRCLQPERSHPNYGFLVMGVAAVLAGLLAGWTWWRQHNAPWEVLRAGGLAIPSALGALMLAGPFLIPKHPAPKAPGWEPVGVWLVWALLAAW
jgi:hypothetical protein